MKAHECKWFTCVYARKTSCAIHGWLDTGENMIPCPYWGVDCMRIHCKYCARDGERGVCPKESEGEK